MLGNVKYVNYKEWTLMSNDYQVNNDISDQISLGNK